MKAKKANESRRNFLRTMGIAVVATAALPAAALNATVRPKEEVVEQDSQRDWQAVNKQRQEAREEKRNDLICQALQTPEGRVALASAMAEPIKRSLEYKSFLRKTLSPAPEGDVSSISSFRHFKFLALSTVRLSDIKARKFYEIDKAQINIAEEMLKDEFEVLNEVLKDTSFYSDLKIPKNSDLSLFDFLRNRIRFKYTTKNMKINRILMHPAQFAEIRQELLEHSDGYLTGRRDVIFSGLHGHIDYGEERGCFSDIYVSSHMDEGVIYLFPEAEKVGTLTEIKKPTVESKDNLLLLQLGWQCEEQLGVEIHPNVVSRITVCRRKQNG